MQKKIIALAIAAAFSAPAFADNANVSVYGKALMTLDQASSDAVGATKQVRVNTNASRFGVKGSEDLGDGLKALYQYEVEMDADGSGANGMGKTRNSGAGMEGGFGKVMLGIWDTPFKTAHNAIELFDNTTSWTSTAVIGRSYAGGTKNFNTRQANMIQYWSPKFSGFQVAAMYSPDEARTNLQNKAVTSISGTYDQDGLYVAGAYETRSDASVASNAAGTVAGVPDTATRLVAKYNFGGFWLGGMLESIKTNFATGTVVDSVTGQNSELVGGVKMGANSIALSFAKQGDTSATAFANGITQTSLKYAYDFSKRTEVFAAYTSNKADGATVVTKSYLGGGLIHSF